jgi:translation initiation factor 1
MREEIAMGNDDDIVFSYKLGDELPKTGKPKKSKKKGGTKPGQYRDPGDGFVRIQLEKSGRKGKGVCVVYGLPAGTDIAGLCRELKKKCGTGGTVRDNRIEIQGTDRDRIEQVLNDRGFKTKRVGG